MLKHLLSVLTKWRILKATKYIVRDGEAKMSLMGSMSEYEDATCFAHTLHLIVSKCFHSLMPCVSYICLYIFPSSLLEQSTIRPKNH